MLLECNHCGWTVCAKFTSKSNCQENAVLKDGGAAGAAQLLTLTFCVEDSRPCHRLSLTGGRDPATLQEARKMEEWDLKNLTCPKHHVHSEATV